MSEQGWRDFLAAENAGDWVVLHGGATAVFPVLSLGDAARLAEAVAQVPGIEDAGVLITIADDRPGTFSLASMTNTGLVSSKGRSKTPRRDHWDDRYRAAGSTAVSWYQERPAVSLELLATADIDRSTSLIDVGGGAGTLVDALLDDGWSDLTVLDVSDVALAVARERVGTDTAVRWIEHDLLTWQPSRPYDVWHDRAVFHFLVEDEDRRRYRHVLRQTLAPSGTIIVGTFASDGPTHCSGLPVARYDEAELVAALGGDFDTLGTTREEHLTPAGAVQPFTWVALRAR